MVRPAADIRRSRMIVEDEAHKALAEFGGTSCKNARVAIEKAIWRAIAREIGDRIDEGWKQPPQLGMKWDGAGWVAAGVLRGET